MPPTRMGGYSYDNNNNNHHSDDAPPPSSSSSSMYQHRSDGSGGAVGRCNSSTPAYNNSNTWGQPHQQLPEGSQYQSGRTPGSAGRPLSGASACSSRSWGSQPPLTSSKRDQNWERKRRQWLARKNGGGGGHGGGFWPEPALPLPPRSAPFGGNPWDDDVGANAPPSPLTKFVHQQSQKQSFGSGGGGGGGFVDYERINTAAASPPPPMSSGSDGYPRDAFGYGSAHYSGGGYGIPPSRCGSATSGATTAMSQIAQERPAQFGSTSSYAVVGATPASRGQPAAGRAAGSAGGFGYAVGANRSGTAASGTARQPPGGHSNWSPFG